MVAKGLSKKEREVLREKFVYINGMLARKKDFDAGFPRQVGTLSEKGYYCVEVGWRGRKYKVHRIVYFLNTGEWPKDSIDHINGVKTDNRIENLRVANRSQQRINSKTNTNSTTGHTGVCVGKNGKGFRAYIYINKKRIALGYFKKLDDAVSARLMAEKKYHGCYSPRAFDNEKQNCNRRVKVKE